MYSIQHYVINFVSELAAGRWFSHGTPVSSYETDRNDIVEILLKVELNNITITLLLTCLSYLFKYSCFSLASLLFSDIKFDRYFSTELILCINAFGHNINSLSSVFKFSISNLQRSASLSASIVIAFTCFSVTLKQNNDCVSVISYMTTLHIIFYMTISYIILLDDYVFYNISYDYMLCHFARWLCFL